MNDIVLDQNVYLVSLKKISARGLIFATAWWTLVQLLLPFLNNVQLF